MTTFIRSSVLTVAAMCALFSTTAERAIAQAKDADSGEPGPSGYVLAKTIAIRGDEKSGGYIEFDPQTRRLFISRGTHVSVLDVDSDKIVGDIPGTTGVNCIALAPDLHRGFTSDGKSNRVTIFDLKNLKILGSAPTEADPEAIVYDPASKHVFTMDGRSNAATAIDGLTGKLAGHIQLGGRPATAVADGLGHVYINLEDKNEEVQIDSRTLKILHRWPMAPCASPRGLAIDGTHRRLLAACGNKIMVVMDADTGRLIATPAIGTGVEADRFDPGTRYAFSSNGNSATLTVIKEDSPDKFRVLDNLPTGRGARLMAIDPITHEVFVADKQLYAEGNAKHSHAPSETSSPTLHILVFVQMSMSS